MMKYHLRHVESQQIENEAQALLKALKTDENLRKEAAEAGINLEEFDTKVVEAADKSLITIKPESAGIAPGVVEIILIFAPAAATIVEDCWKYFILPRLRRRFGANAIQEIAQS